MNESVVGGRGGKGRVECFAPVGCSFSLAFPYSIVNQWPVAVDSIAKACKKNIQVGMDDPQHGKRNAYADLSCEAYTIHPYNPGLLT